MSAMTRSLLTRLPDIVARSAVRASEAMHTLGVKPGPLNEACTPAPEAGAWPRIDEEPTRLQTGHDLALLLNSLIASPQRPSLRGQVGFLWLRATPSEPLSATRDAPGGKPDLEDITLGQAWLSDLAVRLFVARELLAPSALLVLTPTTGLGNCIPLMLKAVMGCEPFRVTSANADSSPLVLACQRPASPAPRVPARAPHHIPSLAQCLSETHHNDRTAVVMRPGADILNLQASWAGDWLLTDPDPSRIRTLRSQLDRQAWALPARFSNRGVQEPVAAWG